MSRSTTASGSVSDSGSDITSARAPAARASLSLSALLIVLLIVLQLGRGGAPDPARAEMSVASGDYAAMTTHSGNDELLYVIDQRREALLVYGVANQRRLELLRRENLAELFAAARAQAEGRGP